MKISEIIRLPEQDGWVLKRTTGSHRHFTHPARPGLVTVAGEPVPEPADADSVMILDPAAA